MIRCSLCPTTATDVPAAIQAGWIPSYYDGDDEQGGPVCPACQQAYLEVDPEDDEWAIKATPHIVKKTP